jgi:hypothetical protein
VWGSLLLAAGTGIAIEGCANTFMRTGKLFPGPHLYAGGSLCATGFSYEVHDSYTHTHMRACMRTRTPLPLHHPHSLCYDPPSVMSNSVVISDLFAIIDSLLPCPHSTCSLSRCLHCGPVGIRCCPRAPDAERQRNRTDSTHCGKRPERGPLLVAGVRTPSRQMELIALKLIPSVPGRCLR